MIKIKNDSKRDFRLLNLTDPQLTNEEWCENNQTGKIFRKTVDTLIERVAPDLITISGDLSYADLLVAEAAFKNPVPDKSVKVSDSYGTDIWNEGYEDSYGVFHESISAYPENEGAFDLICKLNSTKNIICGHDHVNNWVVKHNGVRFIFGTKTGSGCYGEPELNGGTVLTINETGVVSVRHEYVDVLEVL